LSFCEAERLKFGAVIEDRKQAEEKLCQDERALRRITDAIPEMIVVHETHGTPIYANEPVLDYTG
jgi:formate hydrogenlyase transcriptional activator